MDIISLPIEMDHPKLDSRYRLVNIVAHRARQLMAGSKPTVQSRYVKAGSIALVEVLEQDMEVLTGKEARLAQREERRRQEETRMQALLVEREKDPVTEIQKRLDIFLEGSSKAKEDTKKDTKKE